MSWRRGLTRLWIVASLLWGTISVALFWPTSEAETYAAYWRLRLFQPSLFRDAKVTRDEIDKISDAHRILEGDDCRGYTPTTPDNLPHQLTLKELLAGDCRGAHKTLDAETAYQVKLEPVVEILHAEEDIGAESTLFMEVTLLPPLVLFMIGSGLFWAIRGFRPNRGSS
jgi:hypothetical protein